MIANHMYGTHTPYFSDYLINPHPGNNTMYEFHKLQSTKFKHLCKYNICTWGCIVF